MRMLTRMLAGAACMVLMAFTPVSAQEGVTVEIQVARDIVDRMPVGVTSDFPANVGTVWCWTRVIGAEPGTTIEHVWMRGVNEMAVVPLNVGSASWRTYSSKTIPPDWSGEWRVYVRDTNGNVLASKSFTVGTM